MRTTLTLDDDVAARIERLRRKKRASFKTLINDALRAGIEDLEEPAPKHRRAYRLRPVRLGARLPDLDNVAEVLAAAEGESFR